MNLLQEGIEKNFVRKTGQRRNFVGDRSQLCDVYEIQLDQLYYNDQNDRIATWVSQYKTDNSLNEFDFRNKEVYNKIIHDFVTASSPKLLTKTQKSMKIIGQSEPGVVLKDGRIIDGNRRFTCLRNIQEETGEIQYFEAFVFDRHIETNTKEIKMLELKLQHGMDEKVDYNPVEKLVGIYHDIIETRLLTSKEYASSVNQSEKDIILEIEKAKLMVEFLEFINAPKQFHLVRTLNLAELLEELYKMLKSISDEDTKEDLKNTIFAQLLVNPLGDTRQYIRKIKKIVNNRNFLNEYIEANENDVDRVLAYLENREIKNDDDIKEIRSRDEFKEGFLRSTEKFTSKINVLETRNQPEKLAVKALENLEGIDQCVCLKLKEGQKGDVSKQLDMIESLILEIRESLRV